MFGRSFFKKNVLCLGGKQKRRRPPRTEYRVFVTKVRFLLKKQSFGRGKPPEAAAHRSTGLLVSKVHCLLKTRSFLGETKPPEAAAHRSTGLLSKQIHF